MKKLVAKYSPLLIFSAAIFTMVICSITSLADHASRPVAHSASYAVLNSPFDDLHTAVPDQSRAAQASRNGLDSDLPIGESR